MAFGPANLLRLAPRQILLFQTFICILGLAILLVSRDFFIGMSLVDLGNIGTICAFLIISMVTFATRNGIWSASSVYLAVLGAFHFGLTSVLGLGMLSDQAIDRDQTSYWLFRNSTREAVYLSCLGYVACGLGIHMSLLRGAFKTPSSGGLRVFRGDYQLAGYLTKIGSLILILSVTTWFVLVCITGGPELLVSSYSQYLDKTDDYSGLMGFVWFGMGIGLCFLLSAKERSLWKVAALIGFSLFVLFGFPLGLRGEILFSSLPAIVIISKRKRPPSFLVTIAFGITLLFLIGFVKNLRQVGIGASNLTEVKVNGLDGLVELGGSLRPVAEVVFWHENGDDFDFGASYWAPIDRPLVYLIPGWTRPEAENDDRIMNVLVQNRVGPIGFSPIAEAYRNFGWFGVVVIMMAIGLVLGRMDLWIAEPAQLTLAGIILVELLINTRNSFVAVPQHLTFGAVILASIILYVRLRHMGPRAVSF